MGCEFKPSTDRKIFLSFNSPAHVDYFLMVSPGRNSHTKEDHQEWAKNCKSYLMYLPFLALQPDITYSLNNL